MKRAQEAVARAGGLQGLRPVDAGGELALAGEGDRALFAHLVDDDLRASRDQAARHVKAPVRVPGHEAELDIIADDHVAQARRRGSRPRPRPAAEGQE